jgi:hypothetical protein
MNKIAEGLAPDDFFGDLNPLALNGCGFDVERGLFVASRRPLKQFRRSCGIPPEVRVRKRIERIAKKQPG